MPAHPYHCSICNLGIEDKNEFRNHFRKLHRDSPETIYAAIGETWDSTITRLLRERATLQQLNRELLAISRGREIEVKDVQEQVKFLRAKLSAIALAFNSPMDHAHDHLAVPTQAQLRTPRE